MDNSLAEVAGPPADATAKTGLHHDLRSILRLMQGGDGRSIDPNGG